MRGNRFTSVRVAHLAGSPFRRGPVWPLFLGLALFLGGPLRVRAQEVMSVVQNQPGFKAAMAYQNFGDGETVNLANGGLTVAHASGISLPQNLGGTLCPTRIYNSKNQEDAWRFVNPGWGYNLADPLYGPLGMDWSLSYGRVFLRMGTYRVVDNDEDYLLSRPLYFYQDETGAEHRLYLKGLIEDPMGCSHLDTYSGQNDPPYEDWYVTNDGSYIRARFRVTVLSGDPDQSNKHKLDTSVWEIYYPDGSVRYAGGTLDKTFFEPRLQEGTENQEGEPVYWSAVLNPHWGGWYVTRIKDRAANTINVSYKACPTPGSGNQPFPGAIDTVSDQFITRKIQFLYNGTTHLLSSLSTAGMTESFTFKTDFSDGRPRLQKVKLPDGLETYYSYWQSGTSSRFILSKIGYPTGATSSYTFEDSEYIICQYPANRTQFDCAPITQHDVVASRTLAAGAPNPTSTYPASQAATVNTLVWTYQRKPRGIYSLVNPRHSTPLLITDPMGTAELHFFASENDSDSEIKNAQGREIAVYRYRPGFAPSWPSSPGDFDPADGLVHGLRKYYQYDTEETVPGDASRCKEESGWDAQEHCPTFGSYRFGNPRVYKTREWEQDESETILWSKEVESTGWDGFGHYMFTCATDLTNRPGSYTLEGKYAVTAVKYDLHDNVPNPTTAFGTTAPLYQADRLLLSYTGLNDVNPWPTQWGGCGAECPPPPPPDDLTIDGEFKAVTCTYDAATGLLATQTTSKAVQGTFTIDPEALTLSAPATDSHDKVVTLTRYSSGGNIRTIVYSGVEGESKTATFEWSRGMVTTLKWDGMPDKEFTRGIDLATSRIMTHRDASGLTTGFLYYPDGRLKKVQPPGSEYPEQMAYPTETWHFDGQPALPWVVGHTIKYYKGPSSVPSEAPGDSLSLDPLAVYSVYTFDDLGRLWRTNGVDPQDGAATGGVWTEKITLFDPMGRGIFASEPYAMTRPAPFARAASYSHPTGTQSSYTLYLPESTTGHGYGTWDSPYSGATQSAPFTGTLEPFYRTRQLIKGDGSRVTITYDGLNTSSTNYPDAGPSTTLSKKDVLGRLREVLPEIGARARYAYNGLGNLTGVTLVDSIAQEQERSFIYDGLGHLTSSTLPETGTVTYSQYDAIGNLLQYTDQAGTVVQKAYDAKGRPKTVTVGTDVLASWDYDQVGTYGAYAGGKLTHTMARRRSEDGSGVVEEGFTYDRPDGRLGSKTVRIYSLGSSTAPVAPPATFVIGYGYEGGYPTLETFQKQGADTMFEETGTFNRGALVAKTFTDGKGVNGITRYPWGGLQKMDFVNGPHLTASEDSAVARLTGISASGLTGGCLSGWSTGTYGYGGAGEITSVGADTFGYDKLGRLTSAMVHHRVLTESNCPTHPVTFGYSYDDFGNMKTRSVPGGASWMGTEEAAFLQEAVFTATFDDETNRMLTLSMNGAGTPIAYDDPSANQKGNGNMDQIGSQTYSYDRLNQTLRASFPSGAGTGTEDYYYDAAGERAAVVRKNAQGQVEAVNYYARSGAQVLGEEQVTYSSGVATQSRVKAYLYAGGGLAATEEGTAYSISGAVTSSAGPLAGVTLAAGSATVTTDAAGQYSLPWLAAGTYTLAPSLTGYTFSPATVQVTVGPNGGANFTATAVSTIQGTLSGSTGGYTDVVVVATSQNASPPVTVTATPSSTGAYSLALPAGTYIVQPQKTGYCFTLNSPSSSPVSVDNNDVISGYNFTGVTAYSLTLLQSPTGLSVKCGVSGAVSGSYFCPNSKVYLTPSCAPSSLYAFSRWSINRGGVVTPSTDIPLELTMDANLTVTAVFACAVCAPPPQHPRTMAVPNGEDGSPRLVLSWEDQPEADYRYQISLRTLSGFSEAYTGLLNVVRDSDAFSTYVTVPKGCTEYVLKVRSYDLKSGTFSQWSDSVTAVSTPEEPAAPISVTTGCQYLWGHGHFDLTEFLSWTVDRDEACAYTGFALYADGLDPQEPPYQVNLVEATGATTYGYNLGGCPENGPSAQYYVASRMGESESPMTAAVAGGTIVLQQVHHAFTTSLALPDLAIGDLVGGAAGDITLQDTLLLGNGDGTFTPGQGPLDTDALDGYLVRAADMDGDGLLDRVITGGAMVWVEYNAGDGIFQKGTSYALPEAAADLQVGYVPLNFTSRPRVVTGSVGYLTFLELLDDGTWSLVDQIYSDLGITGLRIADLNNDGLADVVASQGTGVTLFSVTPEDLGTWGAEVLLEDEGVRSLDVADADGDGFLDVAVARQTADAPLIYLFRADANADPEVRPMAHTWEPGALPEGFGLAAVGRVLFADFDDAGLPGLVCVADAEVDQVCLYFGNDGNGGLLDAAFGLEGSILAVGAADFDGDGIPDLAVAGDGTLDVYEGVLGEPESQGSRRADPTGRSRRGEAAGGRENLPPQAPDWSDARLGGSRVTLTWYEGRDDATPEGGLTYEVIAGTAPMGSDLYRGQNGPEHAGAQPGNVGTRTMALIPFPAGATEVYWGIRSLDSGLQGSGWRVGVTRVDGTSEDLGVVSLDPAAEGLPGGGTGVGQEGTGTVWHRGSAFEAAGVGDEVPTRKAPSAPRKGGAAGAHEVDATAGRGGDPATSAPPARAARGETFSSLTCTYYITDHLGTVRVVTHGTALVSLHDYEPYGIELRPHGGGADTSGNTHRYTGHERDASTGLDYMHFRYNSASLGRFLRPDNVMGSLTNPQSFNLYSYCGGNPVGMTDPTGHLAGSPWAVKGSWGPSGGVSGAITLENNAWGGGLGLSGTELGDSDWMYDSGISGDIHAWGLQTWAGPGHTKSKKAQEPAAQHNRVPTPCNGLLKEGQEFPSGTALVWGEVLECFNMPGDAAVSVPEPRAQEVAATMALIKNAAKLAATGANLVSYGMEAGLWDAFHESRCNVESLIVTVIDCGAEFYVAKRIGGATYIDVGPATGVAPIVDSAPHWYTAPKILGGGYYYNGKSGL